MRKLVSFPVNSQPHSFLSLVCLKKFLTPPNNTLAGGDAFTRRTPGFATLQWGRLPHPFLCLDYENLVVIEM